MPRRDKYEIVGAYKKLRLAAVVAAVAAKKLAATMVAVATVLAAIQWLPCSALHKQLCWELG